MFAAISKARREEIENFKTFATYKRKIPDIVKAEDTQMDCFTCHQDVIESLPFLGEVEVQNLHLKQQTSKVIKFHLREKDEGVLMYAVAPTHRKKTETVGKLAIGVKEGVLNNFEYNNIGYIMFHYWNNDKVTLYKLLNTPKLVCKQDIPDGYLLRMTTDAENFLLLEYDPNKPADIGEYDVRKVQRKGKGRYLPFVISIGHIVG